MPAVYLFFDRCLWLFSDRLFQGCETITYDDESQGFKANPGLQLANAFSVKYNCMYPKTSVAHHPKTSFVLTPSDSEITLGANFEARAHSSLTTGRSTGANFLQASPDRIQFSDHA
jgi:hypothetical protein